MKSNRAFRGFLGSSVGEQSRNAEGHRCEFPQRSKSLKPFMFRKLVMLVITRRGFRLFNILNLLQKERHHRKKVGSLRTSGMKRVKNKKVQKKQKRVMLREKQKERVLQKRRYYIFFWGIFMLIIMCAKTLT